jgi:coenzyme A diphosphatase NUDT7
MIKEIKNKMPYNPFHLFGFAPLRKSAVLIPLLEVEGETHVLFEIRSHQLKSQPGEICFPGGRVEEEDASEEEAALRETCEELGIEAGDVEVIERLGVLVHPSSTSIFSFVGKINNPAKILPNEEVSEVFTVPLNYLIEYEPEIYYIQVKIQPEENFPFELIPDGRDYKWRHARLPEYFYRYEDKIIWGLTARILHEFITILK